MGSFPGIFAQNDIAQLGNPAALSVIVAAAVLGLTGSLHCFLMCGPLACAPLTACGRRRRAVVAYQAARVGSYALVGGLLGGLGGGVARVLALTLRPIVPWLMIAALLFAAFDLGRRLPPLPWLSGVLRRLIGLASRLGPAARAGLFGAVTPLLPCGLLYGMFLAAAATGSFAGGAAVLGGFALGGVPALGAAQLQLGMLGRWPRLASLSLRRALPVVTAAVLVFRALATGDSPCH